MSATISKRSPAEQNQHVRSVIGKAASLVRASVGMANDDCNEFDRCLDVANRIFRELEGYLSHDLDKRSVNDVQGLVYDIQAVMLGAEKIGTIPGGRDFSYIARQVWEILEPITDELDSLYWPEPEGREASEAQAETDSAVIAPETPMDEVDFEDMRDLIREASGIVERFARLAVVTANDDGFDDLLPQFMGRLLECNSVILSASGGDSVTLGEGYEKVFGRFGPGFDVMFPAQQA